MTTLAEQFDRSATSDAPEPISKVSIVISKASLEELEADDFVEQVDDIITIGDFYEMAAGGQIIFT